MKVTSAGRAGEGCSCDEAEVEGIGERCTGEDKGWERPFVVTLSIERDRVTRVGTTAGELCDGAAEAEANAGAHASGLGEVDVDDEVGMTEGKGE